MILYCIIINCIMYNFYTGSGEDVFREEVNARVVRITATIAGRAIADITTQTEQPTPSSDGGIGTGAERTERDRTDDGGLSLHADETGQKAMI